MVIVTEVTEQDYRALQWSVLIDRAKLHWGVAIFLPMAALLYWFAAGAAPSEALVLRVFASIVAGVGVILLAVMAGQYASRNRPMEDKRVPLGPHAYEVTDKVIVLTSEQRRMEFPVSALQSVTETPSHFFVVVRQGTDLIIPRRGLDAAQTQAVQSFREAVAFSSLHIDHVNGADMTPAKVALSFAVTKWMSLLMAAVLPFTFGSGPISAVALLWAILAGVVVLTGMLFTWRSRSYLWSSGLFIVPLIFSEWAGVRGSKVPDAHFYQWLLVMFAVVGLPLLLLPRFFRRLARLEREMPALQTSAVS